MIVLNFLKNIFRKHTVRWAILILIILGSIYFSLYKYTTPKPEWFACHQDNECTDKTLCNGHAINKDYTTRATGFNKIFGSVLETNCWEREYSAKGSFCKNSICIADEDSDPEDWIKCNQNSDCVEVDGNCGRKEAVNKRFQAVAKKYYLRREHNLKKKCARPREGEFFISCENSQCKGEYR